LVIIACHSDIDLGDLSGIDLCSRPIDEAISETSQLKKVRSGSAMTFGFKRVTHSQFVTVHTPLSGRKKISFCLTMKNGKGQLENVPRLISQFNAIATTRYAAPG
jgi:hypothetical protein